MKTKNDSLIPLFKTLKATLTEYEKYFSVRKNEVGYYDLWSEKDVEFAGHKRKEIFFAGLIIQKHYVGFYFMPVYSQPEIKKMFGEELLTTLKGKSCFYIKHDDPVILAQIEEALKKGLELYKNKGWV